MNKKLWTLNEILLQEQLLLLNLLPATSRGGEESLTTWREITTWWRSGRHLKTLTSY